MMAGAKKWNMVVDIALCHDCNNCFLADKDEFVGNDFLPYSAAQPWSGHRWMNILRKERGQFSVVQVAYLPLPCQHCADAPCLANSPEGMIYRRPDGLVIIDPEKAKGHREIVDTCPYGVIYWNEERSLPQKCTGCAHLLDAGWTDTRCTQVCPTGALKLVLAEDAEMRARAAADALQAYHEEWKASPRVWYKNLHRWTASFIAGSVAYRDTDECAEGATVTLSSEGVERASTTTDNYGDFMFDNLKPGTYQVTVGTAGYRPFSLDVELEESRSLGVLFLDR
jgi:Fe-S-cluster-containing dehydrogenase component